LINTKPSVTVFADIFDTTATKLQGVHALIWSGDMTGLVRIEPATDMQSCRIIPTKGASGLTAITVSLLLPTGRTLSHTLAFNLIDPVAAEIRLSVVDDTTVVTDASVETTVAEPVAIPAVPVA